MALLKESIDTTLSFHAEMFPRLQVNLDTLLDSAAGKGRLSRETMQSILGTQYSYFSADELHAIKSKIREYETNHKSRSGGSELLGCLQRIQTAKESLERNIQQIRDVLVPKVVSRTTLAEATALAQETSIRRVAESFTSLPEKLLRSFAETVVGDIQIEYTVEELPLLIATKQITSVTLDPGKVL